MALQFIDHHRGGADRYAWMPPFDPEVAYENSHWWDGVRYGDDDPWFVQVLENGAEVARVVLVEDGGFNAAHVGVPVIGVERLMVYQIEVATAARGRGIGAQVVHGLGELHRDRRLFAYSEGADHFWESLGWERFNDPRPGPGRTLFIQPASSS